MSLVAVGWPNTQSEMVVMASLLDANGIPHFVHGAAFASVLPGVQIGSYNTRTIFVPESAAQEAADLLSVFKATPSEIQAAKTTPRGFFGWLRMIAEVLVFGWFVSGRSKQAPADDQDGT
jgi:hypothetical protein